MEQTSQLKINAEKELISSIQIYLMDILNTHGVIYDVNGSVINEINASSYCKTLRFVSERKDLCQSYSWELSKSAIHFKKPFEDVCPGGLTLLSMPIYLCDNTVIGAHCVAISNPRRSKFCIYDIAAHFNIDAHILWDAVKKTPPMLKPILKMARGQVFSTTELISKIFTHTYALQQREAAIAEKYRCIKEFFKSQKKD
ncbi:MAG: PocR ligand-binding domain-containing protein [Candidatus Jettenia sp.]|nr:PocR ligand-binding domain-containing protein [Candidatus Jettenia sp.]